MRWPGRWAMKRAWITGTTYRPTYFQTNDQKSLDMYKLCLEKATYDPGTAVNELGNAFNVALAESIYAHTTSVKGALTAMNGTYDAAINAIFNK